MVPDIAKAGHSFKGAMAYYMHDKRQAGDAQHPTTAERVAWTETRNLATDDTRAAMRIMVATAQRADELKKAAGVKATGRKSNAHVYAYSLAWHPDEAGQLDRAEMVRAADSSLQALGAENHQAVIVCHTDQKHPHVHVILNRVDPTTGRMLSTSNDRLKLSDWANAYERERGQILTPKREEKRQLREQFAERSERREYAQEQRRQEERRQRQTDGRDPNPAAALKAFGDQQKEQHRQQWQEIGAKHNAGKQAIYDRYGALIRQTAAQHEDANRKPWAQHFKNARAAELVYQSQERTLSGIVRHAFDAAKSQPISEAGNRRGFLSAVFRNVVDSGARRQTFAAEQNAKREAFAHTLKSRLDAEIRALKEARAAELAKHRQSYQQERTQLIERQNAEREKVRIAWRQIRAERDEQQRQAAIARQRATQARKAPALAKTPAKPAPAPTAVKTPIQMGSGYSLTFTMPAAPAPARAKPTARPGGASPATAKPAQRAAATAKPAKSVDYGKSNPSPWRADAARPAQSPKSEAPEPTPMQEQAKKAERVNWWEQSRSDKTSTAAQPWSSAARSSENRNPWESGIGREDRGNQRSRERDPLDKPEKKQ